MLDFKTIRKNIIFSRNRPRSIYQYSNMAPRLSAQNCKFLKFLLSLNSQKRLEYKENNTKYRSLTRKPRSHVRISIYRTWPIQAWVLRQNGKQKNYAQESGQRGTFSFLISLSFIISQNACLNCFETAFELLLYKKYGKKCLRHSGKMHFSVSGHVTLGVVR